MPDEFSELRRALRNAGLPPQRTQRLIGELEDHLADLRDEALQAGLSIEQARHEAWQRLGATPTLVQAATVESAPGLLAGVDATTDHAGEIGRWGSAVLISAALTSGLLFLLQYLIVV